ncbi:MAG TPA: tail fiber protein, partial [Niastella sp.]|nr:tail fiber protein [Niastella sp.]
MKSLLLTTVLLLSFASYAQNVGVGESAPTAKLEIKADGNSGATNSLLIRNSDNSRLLHMNGQGSATFGNTTFATPGHIIGIHNGLQPSKAHLGLYATGSLLTDAGATNRIVFTNTTNGFRQFEIQSYSGITSASHTMSFKYLNFSTTPATETPLLTFRADGFAEVGGSIRSLGNADFSGSLRAGNFNRTSYGTEYDFLATGSFAGEVTVKKGTGALGLNYIICTGGVAPPTSGTTASSQPLMGEIRMWAGMNPPQGWAFCEGQLLPIAGNAALYSILGTTYGGNG